MLLYNRSSHPAQRIREREKSEGAKGACRSPAMKPVAGLDFRRSIQDEIFGKRNELKSYRHHFIVNVKDDSALLENGQF